MTDSSAYPGTPRWVKVFGLIAVLAILLVVTLLLARGPGEHGPWRHMRPGAPAGLPR